MTIKFIKHNYTYKPLKKSYIEKEAPDGILRHPYIHLRLFWEKHKYHAVADSKRRLNKNDIIFLTILSIASAFLITFIDFLIYLRWSTFSTSDPFNTYHPFVPWLLIAFNLMLLYCFYLKGITFWLVYYPFILAIIYYIIELSLINHWINPQDLMNFFSMFGLGHPPSWLIG